MTKVRPVGNCGLTLRERMDLIKERKARKGLARALRNPHHPNHALALEVEARFRGTRGPQE